MSGEEARDSHSLAIVPFNYARWQVEWKGWGLLCSFLLAGFLVVNDIPCVDDVDTRRICGVNVDFKVTRMLAWMLRS